MKKLLTILSLLFATSTVYAQEKVTELPSGSQMFFIPGFLTKDGKAIMYTQSDDWENNATKLTVFDENMNIVKTYSVPYKDLKYQKKEVTSYRYMNADHTKFTSEWTELSGDVQKFDQSGSSIVSFSLYIEEGLGMSHNLCLTQALFDEDDEFEFLRAVYEVIPITTKEKDYIKEHSKTEESSETGDDEWWRQYGADYASYNSLRDLWILYKTESYGGIFLSGYEVVGLDGVVKKTIDSVQNNLYYYRGNVYFLGGKNNNIVYKLNSHKLPESTAYGPSYDLNRDGKVNAADHVTLSNKILGK